MISYRVFGGELAIMGKTTLLVIAVILTATVLAESGVTFEHGEHIQLRDGCISVGRLPSITFQDDFSGENWRVCNNRNAALSFVHGERSGRRGLIIAKIPGTAADTAFELRSRVLPVKPGVDFSLDVLATGNWEIHSADAATLKDEVYQIQDDEAHGFFGGFMLPQKYRADAEWARSPLACRMVLRWMDRNGAELSAQPFKVHRLPDALARLSAAGTVPEKAAYAQIILGADTPDFRDDNFLMLLNATFTSHDGRYYPNAYFVSRPFPLPSQSSRIAWSASTPGKSSVSIQLSTCVSPEKGDWTPFVGPGLDPRGAYIKSGDVLTALPENHKWMRYKAYLHCDGKKSPVLKSVKIDKLEHEGWSGQDATPPEIRMLTPARMDDAASSLVFEVSDDTGLEWRTVEMRIDGIDVSAALQKDGNKVVYMPKSPFKSRENSFDRLESWSFQDRNALLQKIVSTDGGLRIARDGGEADTSFRLTSPTSPVLPFEKYVFSLQVRGNIAVQPQGPAHVSVIFLDAAGCVISEERAGRLAVSEKWNELDYSVVAPLKAVNAVVCLKMEEPFFFGGHYLEIKDVRFTGKREQLASGGVNLHVVTLQVADLAGNACRRSFPILFSEAQPDGLRFDDNGSVLRGGVPFLPIGFANLWLNRNGEGQEFLDLRRVGVNSAIPLRGMFNAELNTFMGKAHDNCIAVLAHMEGNNAADIIKTVAMAQDKASVICWIADVALLSHYTGDEIEELVSVIHGIAPGQPIALTASWKDENIVKYIKYADVFMPIMTQEDDVFKAMDASRKMCRHVIPIFVLENYEPLLFEMVGVSLLCGARGIVFDCMNPDARALAFAASERLARVADVFNAPKGPDVKVSLGKCNVKPLVMSKILEGRQHIICFNGDWNDVEISFTVKDCDVVRSLMENKTIQVGGTRFSDELKSCQLKIYRLEKLFE